MSAPAPEPRRRPRQIRSREVVEAIVEAGRQLLAEEGPASLTTNRIATRAGVSIGSLYRTFPNKQAVLDAIHDAATGREVADVRTTPEWSPDDGPLHTALAALVDFHLEQERRPDGREGSANPAWTDGTPRLRLERDALEDRMRDLLGRHTATVRVRDDRQAAFLLARGLPAIVRRAAEERPEKLAEPAFRLELIDLLTCYLTSEQSRRTRYEG